MDFRKTDNMPEGYPKKYSAMLDLSRAEVKIQNLAYPNYETEEDFADIYEIWVNRRGEWLAKTKEGCPKPRRRPGPVKRVVTTNGAEPVQRGPKKRFAARIALGLSDDLLSDITAVRGDLSLDDCIRQLLKHALSKPVE